MLTGVLSTDDFYGELAPQLAVALGWSQSSAVSDVSFAGAVVEVRQKCEGGLAAYLEMDMPAVIGLQTSVNPRETLQQQAA